MENKKKLAYAIAKFLRGEVDSKSQEDESLEVAIQCIENAFGITLEDSTLDVGISLPEVFDAILGRKAPVSDEVKANAEKWKNMGNDFIKTEKFQEALECYNKAINLDGGNPVYFCNRAAAHSRLNDHLATISDCKAAIAIEPTYSKAYGRLGLAYAGLNKFQDAKTAYLKALELEPNNSTYRNNLEANEERLRQSESGADGSQPVSMDNLSSLLGNQRLMSMVSQMLSGPQMQDMIGNLMTGNNAPGGFDSLLMAGQQLAQMMQNSNPELVEQLRQEVSRGNDPPSAPQN